MGGDAQRGARVAIVALAGIAWATVYAPLAGGEEHGIDRGRLTVGAAYDFSRGDYGTSADSETHYASLLLSYLSPELSATSGLDDWVGFDATLPYLWLEGPGVVRLSRARSSGREHGLGDVLLRGRYWLAPVHWTWAPTLEISAQVKLPTARERRGLGTGKADYTLELGVSRRIGKVVGFGSGGRRFMGDPSGLRLRDRWLASAGASLDLGRALTLGLLYEFRQSAQRRSDDAHELVPFAGWALGGRWRLGPYGLVGLSRGSPDFAVGLQIRLDLLD